MHSSPQFYALTAAVPALLLSAALQAQAIFVAEDASKLRWQVGSQTEYLFRPLISQAVASPFNQLDINAVHFADLDLDGDLDLLLQDLYENDGSYGPDSSIRYVENVGDAQTPVFAAINADFQGPDESVLAAAIDLDNDGDTDLVFWNDTPVYYENISSTGAQASISAGNFIKQEAAANPFEGLTGFRVNANNKRSGAFLDMDGDGDLDFLTQYYTPPRAFEQICEWTYIENVGTATAPDFVLHDNAANPWPTFPLCGQVQALDMDNDQDVDIFIHTTRLDPWTGEEPYLAYLQNTGSASAPQYVQLNDAANPFSDLAPSLAEFPELAQLSDIFNVTLADIDADQDLDVLVINAHDWPWIKIQSHFFKNTGSAIQPEFTEQLGFDNPWYGVWANSAVALDADKDGDMDILLSAYGQMQYLENVGTPHVPRYEERFGDANPWQGISGANLQILDYDHDGDSDLIVTEDIAPSVKEIRNGETQIKQRFSYIENRSTPGQPNYVIHRDADNPLAQLNPWLLTGYYAYKLHPIDMEADGDWDFVFSPYKGSSLYFHNIGTPTAPQYEMLSGTDNPWQDSQFDGGYNSAYTHWQFIDWDQDGDQDIVLSKSGSGIKYLENTGNDFTPNYVERLGADNPWENMLINPDQMMFFDSDNDGDQDLVMVYESLPLQYFENQTLSPDETETQTPITEEPETQEPVTEEPETQEPVTEEPETQEPVTEEPETQEPVTEEPETQEPETQEPETQNPGTNTETETAEPVFGWEKRAFNWAETVAPDIAPAPGQALDMSPLSVRYYPQNGNYIGYDRETGQIYFLAPPYKTEPLGLGHICDYYNRVVEDGF